MMVGVKGIMDADRVKLSSIFLLPGIVCFFVLFLTGCAGTTPPVANKPVERKAAGSGGAGWWYARFRMVWPENTKADWSIDTLIADRIVSPVLQRYRNRIQLWRFHRRAGRDQTGHQFSFIFYASPETSRQIYQDIGRDPLMDGLKGDGKLKEVVFDNTNEIGRPNYEDTSDKHWPMIIQKSWPHFIQGASRMWLELVQTLALEAQQQHPEDLYAAYRDVQETVNGIWKLEGEHAFLHHLNALFAYQPVIIIEQKAVRF
jgi:hypothetical protein